jgi:hypothetical protein
LEGWEEKKPLNIPKFCTKLWSVKSFLVEFHCSVKARVWMLEPWRVWTNWWLHYYCNLNSPLFRSFISNFLEPSLFEKFVKHIPPIKVWCQSLVSLCYTLPKFGAELWWIEGLWTLLAFEFWFFWNWSITKLQRQSLVRIPSYTPSSNCCN